jgi:hypothetical protein
MTYRLYPEITREAQQAIIACIEAGATSEELARYLPSIIPHGPSILPHGPSILPHGSITKAWIDDARDAVAFRIGERNARYCDPEAFVMQLALTMFGGHAHIDDNSPRAQDPKIKRLHYIWLLNAHGGGPKFTLQRIIAGAGAWEAVRLMADHHDLRMRSLRIVHGGGAFQTREDAIQRALFLYHSPQGRSIPPVLSAEAFKDLLWQVFKLLDDAHGHELQRSRKVVAPPRLAAE